MGNRFGLKHATICRIRSGFYYAQNGKCIYCEDDTILVNRNAEKGEKQTKFFSLDHLVPVVKRGDKNRIWNLIGACAKCNSKKSDAPFLQYYNGRQAQLKIKNPLIPIADIHYVQLRAALFMRSLYESEQNPFPTKILRDQCIFTGSKGKKVMVPMGLTAENASITMSP